jgi:hypothetical protein
MNHEGTKDMKGMELATWADRIADLDLQSAI